MENLQKTESSSPFIWHVLSTSSTALSWEEVVMAHLAGMRGIDTLWRRVTPNLKT
jgi:hypothetical protein